MTYFPLLKMIKPYEDLDFSFHAIDSSDISKEFNNVKDLISFLEKMKAKIKDYNIRKRYRIIEIYY